ncbi:MFS transporter [Oceanospirillum sanctuarii]|uniref:MFS transporter n=1 Tax=Oceanospirillum sanctuarii TaxID=1434821 RepID=UPI000A36DC01|nr:MFS transporter [Oceanospirillum sanctuarii]
MSSNNTVNTETLLSDRQQRANIWLLAIAQALAGANSIVVYATGSIIGNMLAPSPALATLPISIFVVGMAASILPFGFIASRYGRQASFILGTGAGVLTGILSLAAILQGWFWLFCLATFFGGAYAAVVLTYRFAVADGVQPERRARALSLVMAGGIAAGIIGPQLVTWTMYLWMPSVFAATFVIQSLVAALSALLLLGVKLPKPSVNDNKLPYEGRPLPEIAMQPRFIAAALCGAVSYMVMNFLMTAAPLAMHLCGHSQESANLGLQWHVLAMYGPSFFTGNLIEKFGPLRIAILGLILTALSAGVGLIGAEVDHFWWMLIILGLGWNFGFLGASALVLECHQPEEKTRVQALNDFIVFGVMALGSFSSGGILSAFGWNSVLWVSFVPVLLAALFFVIAQSRSRQATHHKSTSLIE